MTLQSKRKIRHKGPQKGKKDTKSMQNRTDTFFFLW